MLPSGRELQFTGKFNVPEGEYAGEGFEHQFTGMIMIDGYLFFYER